jgi:AraC family transcriptional regulator of adaptative response/methylated-DNA-[protein]-cysteine methyltransferase
MKTAFHADGQFDEDACWSAILERDAQAAEAFRFGVLTTGIFCRPTCPARRPKRENLRLFTDAAAARKAGYRPCKRCNPEAAGAMATETRIVRDACLRIDGAEELPRVEDLAAEAGISAAHLNRLFRKVTGLAPKAYMAGLKAGRVRHALTEAGSVTEALYEAGYGSSSRFYEEAGDVLGMTPRDFKAGGKGALIRYAIGQSWLGLTLVAATERGICAILFGDSEDGLRGELDGMFHSAEIMPGGEEFSRRLADVLAAIEQPELSRDLPLDIRGTVFQRRIWAALREIPAGTTASYKEIAERIGEPKAVRAVARACAANRLAVAVPCHRVVRSDGGMAGYRWGTDRKRKLLDREAALRKE